MDLDDVFHPPTGAGGLEDEVLQDDVFHPPNGAGGLEGEVEVEDREVQAFESHTRIVPPRVMVFTTLHCLSLLAMCTDIFLDGTFKVNCSARL